MPLEAVAVLEANTIAPLAVTFVDLFDDLGTGDLRYSAAARTFSGHEVVIEGYLAQSHGTPFHLSLVDQEGICPDCAGVPVAIIALPGARAPFVENGGGGAVRVIGRLDYGLRIHNGVASMLRIEGAAVLPRDGKA